MTTVKNKRTASKTANGPQVASPLGLHAEEFDLETGIHLGNFPHAFSTWRSRRRVGSSLPTDWQEITG